jgi:hypothetical protein
LNREETFIRIQVVIALLCLLLPQLLIGCVEEQSVSLIDTTIQTQPRDHPSILPNWQDGDYHDYYDTSDFLSDLEDWYPDLVNVFSIGNSVGGKDIWCIRLTNEINTTKKYSCLIDGCIHGVEWEAGEACLYLAEYLLINFGNNYTISNILNTTEIYIVPILNPDGRQKDYRFNDNGIDLNRNFDIDFGRIRGGCLRLGKLFNRKTISYIETPRLNKLLPKFPPFLSNCGRRPFSEPETQALRDLSKNLDEFALYVTCHTAAHCVIGPWGAFKPPFHMSDHEINIMSYLENWIIKNTEYTSYRSGEGIVYQGKQAFISGVSTDWFFKKYHIPSLTFEILSEDYEMWMGQGKHDHLVHWMQTTLPVFMYLLVNIENLYKWQTPDISPPLPEGIPPQPLS